MTTPRHEAISHKHHWLKIITAFVLGFMALTALAATTVAPAGFKGYLGTVHATAAQACNEFYRQGSYSGSAPAWDDFGKGVRCAYRDKDGDSSSWETQVLCPDQSSPLALDKCSCWGDKVASGNACVDKGEERSQRPAAKIQAPSDDDCTALAKLKGNALRDELVSRMSVLVQAANAELTRNPASAMSPDLDPKPDPKVGLTAKEVDWVFGGNGGYRPAPGSAVLHMNDGAFWLLYGHAIERLTNRLLIKEACLGQFVVHVPANKQMVAGGAPDFIGTGKAKDVGLQIDVTTGAGADRKMAANAKKRKYQFLTYERGLRVDPATGVAVPVAPAR
jgi:hypothetical protein